MSRHLSKTLLISHKKKFIFIHNYKVGGTSIRKVLSLYQSEIYRYLSNLLWFAFPFLRDKTRWSLSKHCSLMEIEKVFGEKLNEFELFGFVRNPWDYEVSKYEYMKQNKKHFQHSLIKNMTFEEYLEWRKDNYKTQLAFFQSENNFNCKVFKIEDASIIENYLEKIVYKKVQLPKINTTVRNKYADYYKNERSIKIVSDIYKEEIIAYNYEF